MYEEWNRQQGTDPARLQTALLRFRRQEDGRMVAFLHGKAVLLDKKHLEEVAEGDWWIVALDHRDTFAIATPVDRFDAEEYIQEHPEVFHQAELAAQAPRAGADEGSQPSSADLGPATPRRPTVPAEERVALFVDSANMNFAGKRAGFFIDWKRALDHFTRGKRFSAAYFYIGVPREIDESQQGFLDFLSHNGFIVRRKPIKTGVDQDTGETFHKANLDIEIVLDMVNTADQWDTAYLFSGDSDFERAVELLRSRGKQVFVVASRGMLARELGYVADKPIHFIEDLEDELARRDRRPGDERPADQVHDAPDGEEEPQRVPPQEEAAAQAHPSRN